MKRSVTITSLEMTDRAALRPARRPASLPYRIERVGVPYPELNRFFYATIGSRYTWYGRLPWDHARWRAYLARPEVETWVMYAGGAPAGYFELERQDDDVVELVYFGLIEAFTGKGLGGALLTAAIERAWDLGARRVWVHTCDLDGAAALPNYLARGFRVFKVETADEDLPDAPLEPWPGAGARG